jgi:hypothetical protein
MVPRLEECRLRLMEATAREFADEGRFADGYDCLLKGLHRAKRDAEQAMPWAAELVLRYLQAMDDYIARHGVRMG